jgi:hypothetical protein
VSEPCFGRAFSLRGQQHVVELRYALNDGVEKVDVQSSWDVDFYHTSVRVVNGRVKTNDDVVIMGLMNAGFELVPEQEPDAGTEDEGTPKPETPKQPAKSRSRKART